jgi:Asp-tRNA(Asn)/Glu-tRNA(Gln) amidotransferase A subunit family amidase
MLSSDALSPMRPFLKAAAGFVAGKFTPRDFFEDCLGALARHESQIGAFATLTLEAARAAADRSTERWRAGNPLSPIDGMPLGVKDVIETADAPTEMGSPLFAGWRSMKDAASVAALREAGAVIVGKTVTTEFAALEPRGTRNPWNLAHTPGGSSSGSAAAVAGGMVSAALGTQVIGSTIRPASYCGVFGFKPTVGALNREGSHDYQSQSCTGVLAASLEDAWQVGIEIAKRVGGDAGDPGLSGPDRAPAAVRPKRLALLETAGWPVASDAAVRCLTGALAQFATAGIEIRTRDEDKDIAALEQAIAKALVLSNTINTFEVRWFIRGCVERDASQLSKYMLEKHAEGERITRDDYAAALQERARVRTMYARMAETFDACVTLSAPGAAPVGLKTTGNPVFAVPGSLLGCPALSLPVFQVDNMPLGLQILGFAGADARAFATGAWLYELAA